MHVSDTGGVLVAMTGVDVPTTVDVLVAISEVVVTESELDDVVRVSSEKIERVGVLVASDVTVCAAIIVAVPITAMVVSPATTKYALLRIRSFERCMLEV